MAATAPRHMNNVKGMSLRSADPPVRSAHSVVSRGAFERPEDRAVVAVSVLRAGETPRLAGEDPEHVRALAECEEELPPILVDRSTMRVIDGAHRLQAARLRGAELIEVRF